MSYSAQIFARVIGATFGSYVIAVMTSFAFVQLLTWGLSSQLSDAVYAATLWSYVVFFASFITHFSVKSIKHLLLGWLIILVGFGFTWVTGYRVI